ncbi:TPA: ORF6C domain-containing protein [Clostridium botulinum]|uniref:ORF6C domain-containing protein n=1 Tax=Clostridium botulinum TaxID=1491 RepID=UPI0029B4EA54|nr:ORF6C domain-containing protein [Clostridium botulinum]HDK7188753.1 ORF6C domain-containing protein [Clostridium botulinum]HDK7215672.1 ORF6C domain-containing protein [Clostridium botulinum]HDK7231426.1 ORF6C domain-containing protein [Clostridium botulinum]HDK7261176.1 ORF6C domain-containing protein [Clostridium botulinum]
MKKIDLTIEKGQPVTTEIKPIVVNDKRILTTKQLAEVYQCNETQIQQNFNNHSDKFILNKHYFLLKGDDLRNFKRNIDNIEVALNVNKLYLWTERGANRHCKILDTDKAWEQFDNLEETYFRVKEMDPYKGLSPELKAVFILDKKTQQIEEKVNNLESNMPLFNIECKELQALVRKAGIRVLGGYRTPAYKDNSIRGKVYTDIQGQLKRQFGISRYEAIKRSQLDAAKEILENYAVPIYLEDQIINVNNQVSF